jgi:parallel beta helix pectate lyase-like protein
MHTTSSLPLAIVLLIGFSTASWAQVNCAEPIPSGASAADIQWCLSEGGTVVLQDGGVYDIDTTLEIVAGGTVLKGETNGDNRPTLRATPDLHGHILVADDGGGISPRDNYSLEYLVFDGNLSDRLSQSDNECPWNRELGNVLLTGTNWTVSHVVSTNAICKSGMEMRGAGFEITDSTFANNGRDMWEADGRWSDGLTVWNCDGGHIYHNTFIDNTDVNLIVGGGFRCVVEDNVITNISKHAFAGMNVGTFGPDANHSGSIYRNNTILSAPNQMAFGLMVGDEPWWNPWSPYMSTTNAGEIYGNTINGAVVNLAIDGIGDGSIHDNYPSAPDGWAGFSCNGLSANFTAHNYGNASISGDWQPIWFFTTANRQKPPFDGCGFWDVNLPRADNRGALVHQRSISPGESLWSDNGLYRLTYQAETGALVVYDANGALVYDFRTPEHEPGMAIMQWDGNFVVYDANFQARFDTRTDGYTGAYLVMQGDGNVVIYDLLGVARWSSWFGML